MTTTTVVLSSLNSEVVHNAGRTDNLTFDLDRPIASADGDIYCSLRSASIPLPPHNINTRNKDLTIAEYKTKLVFHTHRRMGSYAYANSGNIAAGMTYSGCFISEDYANTWMNNVCIVALQTISSLIFVKATLQKGIGDINKSGKRFYLLDLAAVDGSTFTVPDRLAVFTQATLEDYNFANNRARGDLIMPHALVNIMRISEEETYFDPLSKASVEVLDTTMAGTIMGDTGGSMTLSYLSTAASYPNQQRIGTAAMQTYYVTQPSMTGKTSEECSSILMENTQQNDFFIKGTRGFIFNPTCTNVHVHKSWCTANNIATVGATYSVLLQKIVGGVAAATTAISIVLTATESRQGYAYKPSGGTGDTYKNCRVFTVTVPADVVTWTPAAYTDATELVPTAFYSSNSNAHYLRLVTGDVHVDSNYIVSVTSNLTYLLVDPVRVTNTFDMIQTIPKVVSITRGLYTETTLLSTLNAALTAFPFLIAVSVNNTNGLKTVTFTSTETGSLAILPGGLAEVLGVGAANFTLTPSGATTTLGTLDLSGSHRFVLVCSENLITDTVNSVKTNINVLAVIPITGAIGDVQTYLDSRPTKILLHNDVISSINLCLYTEDFQPLPVYGSIAYCLEFLT